MGRFHNQKQRRMTDEFDNCRVVLVAAERRWSLVTLVNSIRFFTSHPISSPLIPSPSLPVLVGDLLASFRDALEKESARAHKRPSIRLCLLAIDWLYTCLISHKLTENNWSICWHRLVNLSYIGLQWPSNLLIGWIQSPRYRRRPFSMSWHHSILTMLPGTRMTKTTTRHDISGISEGIPRKDDSSGS